MSQRVILSVSRIAFAALLFFGVSKCCIAAPPTDKPNVIVIMTDDFGFECIGANGGKSYKTPVLDRLAAKGMRFDQCYVQPLCTPTRVQLMTGKYNIRNYTNFGEMDPESFTFGNLFKNAGYATCIAGKWQLGQNVELPKKFGFDESCLWQHTRRPERYRNPGLEINGVEKDWTNGEYGPDLVNDYAIDFITRKKDQPFFLYYPMILTHSPYTATPDSEDYGEPAKGKAKKNKKQPKKQPSNTDETDAPAAGNTQYRHFADMVAYTDKLVGKLTAKLDDLKLSDNTLLIFLGDNGTGKGTPSILNDREFVGGKGMMTHRGMHVPLIVSWPAKMKVAGRVSHDLVDSTDIFATIAEAAGIPLPSNTKIDGKSFCAQLRGEPGTPREWYYSWYAPRAVFVGEFAADHRYKLYRDGKFYDLREDLDEQRPLRLSELKDEAAASAKKLQSVLDQFQDARPPELAKRNRKQK
jgi:arylsulfatase A